MYVSGEELLQSLHLTLTGISSSVYVWDSASEQFTLRAVPQGTSGTLVLVGTDEVISARSVICISAMYNVYSHCLQYCRALLDCGYADATSRDTGARI